MIPTTFLLLAALSTATALEPLSLMDTVVVNGIDLNTKSPPKGLRIDPNSGLLMVDAVKAQVVHRTQTRILETRATITPKGDYLLMFPEGDHYAKSKGEKINSMMACRSTDKGKTWSKSAVAYDIPYGQHGFIPLIPRGTQRIYCFGTQPVPGKWTWEDGKRENAPIGWRTSDDDGHTWSDVTLIEPLNDPKFMGMSVMRMTETDAGTWLLGSHLADWSVKPFTTQQYLLRSEVWASISTDEGHTWSTPRFVLANAVAPVHAVSGFNSQCSCIDAFTEYGVLHLFMPHRWQQVLHLTLKEDALTHLPSQAFIKKLAQTGLRLPSVISDHMVLQADKPAAIWGWANAGDVVQVEFAGQSKSTKADAKGEWLVKLDPLPASAHSQTLRINDRIIQDVLIGEVWLASGQSNMAMKINGKLHGKVDNADAEVASAKHPEIRVFVHDTPLAINELPVPAEELTTDRPGQWRVCSPETVANFSAMGHFVARDLHTELKQPVGILTSAVGGTPIEAWTSLFTQQMVPELEPLLDDWTKRLDGFVPKTEQKKFLEAKEAG